MASETNKTDLSELKIKCGEGDFICAERIFYPKDKSHFIECESSTETKTKCYMPDSYVDEFFNIIDPEKLYNRFNKGPNSIMSAFVAELNDKLKQNETVKKELISVYGVDVTSLDNILSEYVPRETNDQELCHDIIGNVCLNSTPKSKSIFHISIHPKTSRCVTIGNRKNRIGSCGYYKKPDKKPDTEGSVADTEGSVPDTEGSGSFHYKIDNILDPLDMDKPFKRFINAADGTFTENSAEFKRKGNKETDTTNATLYELHNFFYEEFRKFWNNIITKKTPDIFNTTTSEVPEPEPDELAQVPDVPLVPQKRPSQQGPAEGLESERKSSRKDPDPSLETSGEGKRIRRKTIKKKKTIKKRKTIKKKKTKKRKPIKKRKTNKR